MERLTTPRLILRAVEDRDIDAIVQIVGDYGVSKWLAPVPHPYTRADANAFVADVRAGKLGMIWAIEFEGACVGMVGAGPTLGYWLTPSHWGRGIMSEAVRAAVDAYFEASGAEDLPSSYFIGNEGSAGVLRANGFEDVGDGTTHSLARGCDVPNRRVLLTRERWRALRASAD